MVKLYRGLLEACGVAVGLTIAAIAAMVSLDVAIRNLGIGNFPWLLEVAEYALYACTFVAAPWVLHLGAHVRVDLLLESVPAGLARALEIATDLVGAGVCAVMGWYAVAVTWESHALHSLIFKELVIPEWWLLAIMPVPCLLLVVEFVGRAVRAFTGRPPPEDEAPIAEGL